MFAYCQSSLLGKRMDSGLAQRNEPISSSKSGNKPKFADERSSRSAVAAATATACRLSIDIHFGLLCDYVNSSPSRIDLLNSSGKPTQALRCMSVNSTKLPHSNSPVQQTIALGVRERERRSLCSALLCAALLGKGSAKPARISL